MTFIKIKYLFILIVCMSCAKEQHLKKGNVINITKDDQAYSVSTIAANPLDSKKMVAAVIRWKSLTEGQFKYNVTTYISNAKARSWSNSNILSLTDKGYISRLQKAAISEDGIIGFLGCKQSRQIVLVGKF